MGKEYLKCIKNHFPKTCLLPTVRFLAHVLVQIVDYDTISIIYRKASGDYVSYDQTQCQLKTVLPLIQILAARDTWYHLL